MKTFITSLKKRGDNKIILFFLQNKKKRKIDKKNEVIRKCCLDNAARTRHVNE
jgi:hypothetical protein